MNKPALKRQKNNPPHPGSESAFIVRETRENTKLRRSLVAKQLFQNPAYRASVLARVRSPEFQARGRIARAKRFQEDPAIFKRRGKTLKDHRLEQLKQLLGGGPKQVLEDLHLNQGLSQTEIAHRFHRNPWTVGQWFKRFGIVTIRYTAHKTGGSINSEARELVLSAMKNGSFEKLPQKRKKLLSLRYLQTGKPLTLYEIGEKLGGLSRQRVHEFEKNTLHRLQINKTPEEAWLRNLQNMKNPEWGKTLKAHKLERLKQLLGGDPKEVLEDLHLKQGLSQTEIAHRFHKNPQTVSNWFKRFGIIRKEAKAIHDNNSPY